MASIGDPDGGVGAANAARADKAARRLDDIEAKRLKSAKSEEARRKKIKASMGLKVS